MSPLYDPALQQDAKDINTHSASNAAAHLPMPKFRKYNTQTSDELDGCSSTKSGIEDDTFDIDDMPMPRISSSTVPVVLEIARRSGGSFASADPLFRGVCLYDGSMKASQREEFESKVQTYKATGKSSRTGGLSWLVPSIFSNDST